MNFAYFVIHLEIDSVARRLIDILRFDYHTLFYQLPVKVHGLLHVTVSFCALPDLLHLAPGLAQPFDKVLESRLSA
ncbi:hypothetical protein CEP53_011788 [Fusarium sp. AF-6]|nr:hypothetical protein CEP53_011788 [Fusarium sp. AF-6]